MITFNQALPNVHAVIQKRQKTLHQSDRMQQIFPQSPVVAYRRDANLQDILIHKKHNKQFFGKDHKCEPCGKNCALCPYIHETNRFAGPDGKEYTIRNYINCKSTNVIYAIFCKRCQKYVYVGETGDTLYQRQLLNLSMIRRRRDDPVAKHFFENHHNTGDFSVVGLEKLFGSKEHRQTREKLWIKKIENLQTLWHKYKRTVNQWTIFFYFILSRNRRIVTNVYTQFIYSHNCVTIRYS